MLDTNLKEWAASQGIAYITARRQYAARALPVPTYRLGRLIMVGEPLPALPVDAGQVVLYARLSSADQKAGHWPGSKRCWTSGPRNGPTVLRMISSPRRCPCGLR